MAFHKAITTGKDSEWRRVVCNNGVRRGMER